MGTRFHLDWLGPEKTRFEKCIRTLVVKELVSHKVCLQMEEAHKVQVMLPMHSLKVHPLRYLSPVCWFWHIFHMLF